MRFCFSWNKGGAIAPPSPPGYATGVVCNTRYAEIYKYVVFEVTMYKKNLWTPSIDEELPCVREMGNANNLCTAAVQSSGVTVTVSCGARSHEDISCMFIVS